MQTSVLLPNSNNIIKKCPGCMSSVFANDAQVSVSEAPWHKVCFKCNECKCQLTLSNYTMAGEVALCKTHYFTRFYKNNSYGGGDKFVKKSTTSEYKEDSATSKVVDSSQPDEREVIASIVSIEKMMQKFTTNDLPSPTITSKKLDELQVPIVSDKSDAVLPKSNTKFKPTQAIKCPDCNLTVYHNDSKVTLEGNTWHNSCFKCQKCKCQLTLSNYTLDGVKALCKTHYLEQFHLSNSYGGEEKFFKVKNPTNTQDDDSPVPKDDRSMSQESEGGMAASVKGSTGLNINIRWECVICSVKNMPSATKCSMCEAPKDESTVQSNAVASPNLDVEVVAASVQQLDVASDISKDTPAAVGNDVDYESGCSEGSKDDPIIDTTTSLQLIDDVAQAAEDEVVEVEEATESLSPSLSPPMESMKVRKESPCPPAPSKIDGSLDKEITPNLDDGSTLLSPSAVAKAQIQKPVRFVGQPKCHNCSKSVYHNDLKVQVNEQLFHQACFKCAECDCKLTLASFTTGGDKVYCKPHYFALFHKNNGYAGAEQFKRQ